MRNKNVMTTEYNFYNKKIDPKSGEKTRPFPFRKPVKKGIVTYTSFHTKAF